MKMRKESKLCILWAFIFLVSQVCAQETTGTTLSSVSTATSTSTSTPTSTSASTSNPTSSSSSTVQPVDTTTIEKTDTQSNPISSGSPAAATTQEAVTAEKSQQTGIDKADGTANSLADFIINSFSKTDNICDTEPVLSKYYTLSQTTLDFFHGDSSLKNIFSTIFPEPILKALLKNCTAGTWCLSDDVLEDLHGKNSSSTRPMCADDLFEALNAAWDKRYECDNHDIQFLLQTVNLLCVERIETACYMRTLEAVFVFYLNMGTKPVKETSQACSDFKAEMTKTYLCAYEVCPDDEEGDTVYLSDYAPWRDMIAMNATNFAKACNLVFSCPDDDYVQMLEEIEEIIEAEEEAYYDELEEELEEEMEEEEEQEEKEETESEGNEMTGSDDQINAENYNDEFRESETQSMLFGIITLTIVAVFGFLSLTFIGYRRFRKSRAANYRRGYSQLAEEEARMLKNEYN